ncbi:MAG: hypothetical protein K6G88_07200 [Lachnospiraceae bacterium]|nr:hypothetical protein [Lachnospiraceae bacterium]
MIFGKRKQRALISEVETSRNIVHDFRRRLSYLFEGYRPVNYYLPPGYDLEVMKERIDKILEQLMAANALDSGNEDCLVETILGFVRNGIPYLDDQALEHRDFFARYSARLHSDYLDIKEMLKDKEEQLDDVEEEHEFTRHLWNSFQGRER